MTIERLTSLETQLELLTTSVEEKDQELARLQKLLDSQQPACPSSQRGLTHWLSGGLQ